jgi:ABC-type polysaccharide/polyol phosphate transport system ATPase subunit
MVHIKLDNVCLTYPVYGTKARLLKTTLMRRAVGAGINQDSKIIQVDALQNIDLELKENDRLGIIGHNGCGKTSLLKVLAQIYEPTSGKIQISGSVQGVFDIMLGMDSELSGYENIYLRGIILGYSRKEIEKMIPGIEAFAELGDFLKIPVKSYSAGMLLRLAFGIITGIQTEILLIDEIVNAGDARFIERAKDRIKLLINNSAIMVITTHDHSIIKQWCNKALLLEGGRIKSFGSVEEVLDSIHQPSIVGLDL